MRTVIRSLARNVASPVALKTIMDDAVAVGEPLSDKTLATYLDILGRLYILDDVEPWSPYLRSKTTIRAGYKRNFVDPSLAVAALLASEDDLRKDFRTFGLVLEGLGKIRSLELAKSGVCGKMEIQGVSQFGASCVA